MSAQERIRWATASLSAVPPLGSYLNGEQRRDVTERNSVMNQRNIVIEERQGEARVAGECFLLIDQLV